MPIRAVCLSLLFAATGGGATVSQAAESRDVEPREDIRAHMPTGVSLRPVANDTPSAAPPHRSVSDEETLVWRSPGDCERVVRNGGHMVMRSPDVLRVGTWNIRWFPRGRSPNRPNPRAAPTDVGWLTCVLVWMQPDILVVQESLTTARARDAWTRVLRTLEHHTGEPWDWSVQPCGRPDRHHIGVLWNANRTTLSDMRSLWRLNPRAGDARRPCGGGLRPGHYAHVRSTRPSGADFHLIGLHLKSGATGAAGAARLRALRRLDAAVADLPGADRDVIVLGDFNTMGNGKTGSQRDELHDLRRRAANAPPGFRDMRLDPPCSQYFLGRGEWLDHVLVAHDMAEVSARSARVTGWCAVATCRRIRGESPLAYQRLSDHCPVILDIENHDRDAHP